MELVMKSQGMAIRVSFLIITLLALSTGCRSEFVVTANLMVGTIPCVLMYLVLNLKREK